MQRQQLRGPIVGPVDQVRHLPIDLVGHVAARGLIRRPCAWAEVLVEAVLGDHVPRDLLDLLEVAVRTGCRPHLAKLELLGHAPAERHDKLVLQVLLTVQGQVRAGVIERLEQRHAAHDASTCPRPRHNADLFYNIEVAHEHAQQGMSGFVVRNQASLLLGHQRAVQLET